MAKRYPTVDKVNLTDADQEYSYTFPAGTKSILLQTRTGEPFKYAFKSRDITDNDNYVSANRGMAKMEDYSGSEQAITIYFSCSTAGEVMEVELWR